MLICKFILCDLVRNLQPNVSGDIFQLAKLAIFHDIPHPSRLLIFRQAFHWHGFSLFPAGDGPHPTPCLPDASVEAAGGGEQHEVVLKLPHDTRAGRNADTSKAA